MHGPDCGEILLGDGINRPAALLHIAHNPSQQADISRFINKYSHIKKPAQFFNGKQEYPVDHNYFPGLDPEAFPGQGVDRKIIDLLYDRLPVPKALQVFYEQGNVKRVRMNKIEMVPLLQRQVRAVAVIRVSADQRSACCAVKGSNFLRQSGLSGTASAADADEKGSGHGLLLIKEDRQQAIGNRQ
jgi:hypothetical protein